MAEAPGDILICKEPCPKCGSSDNLGRYADGHAHCYGSICDYFEPPDDDHQTETSGERRRTKHKVPDDLYPIGKYVAIPARGLTVETCKKFNYSVGKTSKGAKCHIATLYDDEGNPVAQHLRLGGKQFPWKGDKKKAQLFGQHIMRDAPTKVIITEGEIDAMSVDQIISASKNRWCVLSLKNGAGDAARDIASQLPALDKAHEVILMFDNDDPGKQAAIAAARVFKPGKCKIATLPLKDANEMLLAGREAEVVDAIFAAKEYRPDGIVSVSDVREKVLTMPTMGLPWWIEELNEDSYGRQYGELVGLGAGTGVGKTDYLTQQVIMDITELGLKVGIFFLEQEPEETVKRLTGKLKGVRYHIPPEKCDPPWTLAELGDAVAELEAHDNLRMYDHFGVADYDRIEEAIRHMYHAEDIRVFYLDHLTALAAQADDEKKELERIMSMLGGLVKEIPIWVCYVSHLTTPDGVPHEEGGRVKIRHFKGSRSIGYWSHRMYGLERNQQADDEWERTTTVLRNLKDRPVGTATGKTYGMGYDENTGKLFSKSLERPEESSFGPDDDGGSAF
jgi:twinkle protein